MSPTPSSATSADADLQKLNELGGQVTEVRKAGNAGALDWSRLTQPAALAEKIRSSRLGGLDTGGEP